MMRRAFTLIELLIVMGLIALLMSVVMPAGKRFLDNINKRVEKSKERREFDKKLFEAFLTDSANLDENISSYGIRF